MRLYPPVPFVSRCAEHDVQLGSYTVPKGTSIEIFIYAMHHNRHVWGDDVEVSRLASIANRRLPEQIRVDEQRMVAQGYSSSLARRSRRVVPMSHHLVSLLLSQEFKPERFDLEDSRCESNSERLGPFAYLPFSAGPR